MRQKNTLNKGSVRWIAFEEGGVWYGVALELNIVEEGDSPLKVIAYLFQAVTGYIKTVQSLKMDINPLNQETDREYEDMWDNLALRGVWSYSYSL